jgi:type I restriction enzyme S subunit
LATGPFGSAISAKHFVDDGVPVIRGSNLSLDIGVRLRDEKLAFLTPEKAISFARSIVRRGDLIFTCWGTIGQVGLVDDRAAFDQYVVSNKQMKLTPDPSQVDSLFLYYLMSSPAMVAQVQQQSIGAAVPGFNLGQLRQLRVRVPKLASQQRIAAILGALDDLIENNRRRIQILEEMAKAIYREWFVHFRLPGSDTSALMPGGWKVRPLVEVAEVTMGQSPPSQFYNEDGIGTPFHQGVTDFGTNFPINRKFCTIEGRKAKADDILVSVRAPVGRINVALHDLVIGRGLAAVRSRTGHQAFLLRVLRDSVFAEEDSMGGGTIFKAIGKSELEQADMMMPPATIADSAEQVFAQNLKMVKALTLQERCLASLRDVLLPRLLSGQVDVSDLDLDAVVEATA